jgi:hypothetical protein
MSVRAKAVSAAAVPPLAALALTLIATCAYGQEPSMDFNQEGMAHYCFYNGKPYSIGSMLCIPQSKSAIVCQSNADEQNKSNPGRAVWKPKPSDITCK